MGSVGLGVGLDGGHSSEFLGHPTSNPTSNPTPSNPILQVVEIITGLSNVQDIKKPYLLNYWKQSEMRR